MSLGLRNKLDLSNLRARRSRNQQENRKQEQGAHQGKVSQIRAACGFRQFQKVTGVDFAIFDICRSVVCITHGESDESQAESE